MKRHEFLKFAALAALGLALTAPAEAAKRRNPQAARRAQQQQKARAERERKERAERKSKREKIQAALEAKDKNNDGSLSREEYLAGESDAAAAGRKFDQFNKNKDRFLSKGELADSIGL